MKASNYNGDQILALLIGEGDFYISCRYADMPTDPNIVFTKIKDSIIEDDFFRIKLINSLEVLATEKNYSWLSLYYLYGLIRVVEKWNLPIDLNEVIYKVELGIKKNEAYSKSIKLWVVSEYDNGLWGDIIRMAANIYEEFGYSVYPHDYYV